MTGTRVRLTRPQILAFRRHASGLDERLAGGAGSLRRAAWAGLQDSMPRAAVLSIHARVAGTGPSTWEDPSLVQLWGPRFHVYVVAARDLAVFSLGTLPGDAKGRRRAEDLAARRHEDDLWAGRPRARGAPQQPQVRGSDRNGPDPVGWRTAAGNLDRATARNRTRRRPPGTRPPLSACLRPGHGRGLWPVGGGRPAARRRGVRGAWR